MRPKGSAAVLLARRIKTIKLLDENLSLNEIARRIGCNASSVMRWRDRWLSHGQEGLRVRFSPGRPSRMTRAQKRRLLRCLIRGPLEFGWSTDVWTTRRIVTLIKNEFSISYHFTHVARLLHAMKWSPQKPERRALERNEAAIEKWKDTTWKKGKKLRAVGRLPDLLRRIRLYAHPHGAQDLGTHGMHPDHSTPLCQRSDLGDLGDIREPDSKAIGTVWHVLLRQHCAEEVVVFLHEVLRHLRGHVIALLDNGSIHKGAPLQDLRRRYPRLHIEYFPGYAPDLNPDEAVWKLMKGSLANGRPDSIDELDKKLQVEFRRVATSQSSLRYCIRQSHLPISLA